jgi:hypothetical protein
MKPALLLAAAVILIRDPTGKWAGDPLQPWFESLRNKAGLYCCARADGHPLDDGEWDIKDNSCRVFVRGQWILVPDDAVISSPNKFGKAIVWISGIKGNCRRRTFLVTSYCVLFRDRGFDRVT